MSTQIMTGEGNLAMNIIGKGKGELFTAPDRGTSNDLEVLTNV